MKATRKLLVVALLVCPFYVTAGERGRGGSAASTGVAPGASSAASAAAPGGVGRSARRAAPAQQEGLSCSQLLACCGGHVRNGYDAASTALRDCLKGSAPRERGRRE